jgi:Flp pilus assembly pilin Flp
MLQAISGFLRHDDGQDLADYCLLTALVALIAAGILVHISGGLDGLWSAGRENLDAARSSIQSGGTSGKAK